jgi:hypothetical protein
MLTVYLYNTPKPPGCFDLSLVPMTGLADAALAILTHHKTAVIWFGYLEGWMLDAAEETRMRAVIRTFECHVVSKEPMSFSQAWKNEMYVIHLQPSHGAPHTHNHGGAVHSQRPFEHEPPSGVPPIDGFDHQD